jgi:DNA-binding MarR family transcriptional regulator
VSDTRPTEIAEQMVKCVKRLGRLIDGELSAHGLSLSRAKLLDALDRNGPSNQAALATTFDLAPRTVTELVDVLERDGLVERKTDPADRRARQVHLTAAGREAHRRALATRTALIERVFGPLGEDRLRELSSTLGQIDRVVGNCAGHG